MFSKIVAGEMTPFPMRNGSGYRSPYGLGEFLRKILLHYGIWGMRIAVGPRAAKSRINYSSNAQFLLNSFAKELPRGELPELPVVQLSCTFWMNVTLLLDAHFPLNRSAVEMPLEEFREVRTAFLDFWDERHLTWALNLCKLFKSPNRRKCSIRSRCPAIYIRLGHVP